MSGSMLGLMLTGPCRIDLDRIPALIEQMRQHRNEVLAFVTDIVENGEDDLDDKGLADLSAINDVLDYDGVQLLEYVEDPEQRQEVIDQIMTFLGYNEAAVGDSPLTEDLGTFVQSFVGFWNGDEHASDSAIRDLPFEGKDHRVIFAGEMSWGDEPNGTGYTWMRRAVRTGLIDILGIR